MANGLVQIHDPLSNHNDRTCRTDQDSDSDTENMKDMEEYRIMMAYAKRRRVKDKRDSPIAGSLPSPPAGSDSNGTSPAKTEQDVKVKKNNRRKGLKRLTSIFGCIKPQNEELPESSDGEDRPVDEVEVRCALVEDGDSHDDVQEGEELQEVASRLTNITDEIPFTPPEWEEDSPGDDANVEKLIGLLLRETGDRLNQKELQDALRATELFWNYSFFERLVEGLLRRLGLWNSEPEAPGPQTSPKTQIALTCEVTSRLSAADTLPMNRLMGYGATYLMNHFSSWAKQQGGYEAAFGSEDDDEELQ